MFNFFSLSFIAFNYCWLFSIFPKKKYGLLSNLWGWNRLFFILDSLCVPPFVILVYSCMIFDQFLFSNLSMILRICAGDEGDIQAESCDEPDQPEKHWDRLHQELSGETLNKFHFTSCLGDFIQRQKLWNLKFRGEYILSWYQWYQFPSV